MRMVLLVVVLAASGCDCGATSTTRSCESAADCAAGEACIDGRCGPRADGGPSIDAPAPPDGCTASRVCGSACCAAGEICGGDRCCPRAELCGTTCCGPDQVCEGAICHLDCGAAARCGDADGGETCCAADEVCASGRCFLPTTTCRDFIDCPAGEYCERSLGTCLPQPGGEPCETRPSGGAVVPTLLWHWNGAGAVLPSYNQVMMTPVVGNLTDDDGDGRADENDVPDVAFITFNAGGNYSSDGVLRVVRGTDGTAMFDITDPALRTNPGGQLALGDLDGDGFPEIVACGSAPDGYGPVLAFRHDGTLFWRSTDARVRCTMAGPLIADFDADGAPEVAVRFTVLRGADGGVVWHHDCTATGGWCGPHNCECEYTTAADLDGDGRLELLSGAIAYRADGSVLWDRTADIPADGYPAVGDLDLDGRPDVAVVESAYYPRPYQGDHYLRALRGSDGTDLWGRVDLNAGRAPADHVATGDVGGGGPPTIANFDGDPEPEIAAAGAYGYAIFENDGSLKWFAPTHDFSSRKTGSSVFDFDGDGAAEAVYADEYWLRVYDGRDGTVRYCECNTSGTLWEYPVVADVDDDGHAEIVVASNDYGINTCPVGVDLDPCTSMRLAGGPLPGVHGVRAFASPTRDWVGTRRIWNQHTYHVTNVSESGAIPRGERPNWSIPGLNNFRQNVQPGATYLPDPLPVELGVDLGSCPDHLTLDFRVRNGGWSALPAGTPIAVSADPGTGFAPVATLATTRALLPGEAEAFSVEFPLDGLDATAPVTFRVVVDEAGTILECRPANNTAEVTSSCAIVI